MRAYFYCFGLRHCNIVHTRIELYLPDDRPMASWASIHLPLQTILYFENNTHIGQEKGMVLRQETPCMARPCMNALECRRVGRQFLGILFNIGYRVLISIYEAFHCFPAYKLVIRRGKGLWQIVGCRYTSGNTSNEKCLTVYFFLFSIVRTRKHQYYAIDLFLCFLSLTEAIVWHAPETEIR